MAMAMATILEKLRLFELAMAKNRKLTIFDIFISSLEL
jgi:hypothetical protein